MSSFPLIDSHCHLNYEYDGKTVEDLIRSIIPIRGVLAGPQFAGNARGTALLAQLTERRIPIETVDDRDFASASDTDSPHG